MPKKIIICGSIDFTDEFRKIRDKLSEVGFEVIIPLTSEKLLSGEVTKEDLLKEANSLEGHKRKIADDVIRGYYNKISDSDGILIVNMEKKNIPGYIGGNTFLEMGFAHILNKPIYVYNDLPQMPYLDELKSLQPIIINQDLSLIK